MTLDQVQQRITEFLKWFFNPIEGASYSSIRIDENVELPVSRCSPFSVSFPSDMSFDDAFSALHDSIESNVIETLFLLERQHEGYRVIVKDIDVYKVKSLTDNRIHVYTSTRYITEAL